MDIITMLVVAPLLYCSCFWHTLFSCQKVVRKNGCLNDIPNKSSHRALRSVEPLWLQSSKIIIDGAITYFHLGQFVITTAENTYIFSNTGSIVVVQWIFRSENCQPCMNMWWEMTERSSKAFWPLLVLLLTATVPSLSLAELLFYIGIIYGRIW